MVVGAAVGAATGLTAVSVDPCGGDVPGGDGCRCDPPFAAAPDDLLRPYLEAIQDRIREIAAATKLPVYREPPTAPEAVTLCRDDGGSPLDRLQPGMLVPLLSEDGELIQRFIVAPGDDGALRLIPDPFTADE